MSSQYKIEVYYKDAPAIILSIIPVENPPKNITIQSTLFGNDMTFSTTTMKNPFSTTGTHDITVLNVLNKWYIPNIPVMFIEKQQTEFVNKHIHEPYYLRKKKQKKLM